MKDRGPGPYNLSQKSLLFKQKPNASALKMIVSVYTKSTERFKYHGYAIEVRLSLNFEFISSSYTKRMHCFSV